MKHCWPLRDEDGLDGYTTFHGPRGSQLWTFHSLTRPYVYGQPEAVDDLGPPALATPSPSEPADGDGGRDASTQVRRTFLDIAYWNGDITTDENGMATITVDLPDNLTTWRVIVRAVTVETQVGEANANILVTKELIARPALPSFCVLGDRFEVGMVGQNFSGQNLLGTATMTAENLLLLDGAAQSLNLPDGGADTARWTAVASQIGTGLISTTLETEAGIDIVELPFVTKPFAVPERTSASGSANPRATETFVVKSNAMNEATQLTLRLSPSIALGVLDGLESLIGYPYGCVEQIMSRLLPSVVADQAYKALGIDNPKADDLPDIVRDGLQRLYGYQHSDGGWGWFYDDEGGAYLTVYVLLGLLNVEDAGYTVDADVLKRGFRYLTETLPSVDSANIRAYAYYVQALGQRGDVAAARALLDQMTGMDAFSVAVLALALAEGEDNASAQQAIDHLITMADETSTTAYWSYVVPKWDRYHWRTMTSAEKNTAAAVRALTLLRSDHPLLPKAVRWLMEQRTNSYWGTGWRDTQATAFAVLGLVDYIQVSGELQADYSYTVSLNGQEIANGQVTPDTVTKPIDPIIVSGRDLRVGDNTVTITRTGDAVSAAGADSTAVGGLAGDSPLYYAMLLQQELFYLQFAEVTSFDQGLSLKRSYRLLEGEKRDDGAYNKGDLVEVTLELANPTEVWYVLVEDPIPAGFTATNERLNPTSYGNNYFPGFWRDWGYNRKEVHADKVGFFITTLWPGNRKLTYTMRANVAGEFSVPPAQAFAMYREDIWARSGSRRVTVAPEMLVERPMLAGDFDNDCRVTGFDTRLVAAAWGSANAVGDIAGAAGARDGVVDLYDVAAIAERRGATCLVDRTMPNAGNGTASFDLKLSTQVVGAGETTQIEVVLNEAGELDGFGLTLNYAANVLHANKVEWHGALKDALPSAPMWITRRGALPLVHTICHLAFSRERRWRLSPLWAAARANRPLRSTRLKPSTMRDRC